MPKIAIDMVLFKTLLGVGIIEFITLWKFDLSDKIKRGFFQAVAVLILQGAEAKYRIIFKTFFFLVWFV